MSAHIFVIAFFIALSCNLDNVGVGIAYGTRGIRLPLGINLFIALLTAGGTCLAMLFGAQTFLFVSPESGAILGGAILVVMGVWVMAPETWLRKGQAQEAGHPEAGEGGDQKSLWRRLLSILDNPALADQDHSGHIDLGEGALLGLALLLNNLPNGVAAAMLKLPVLLTTLAVGLFSLLTFWLGISLGRSLGSGLILIGIGLAEVLLALPVWG
jgi:putative sporulation protein YtaF